MKVAIYNGQKDVKLKEMETPHAGNNEMCESSMY